MLILVLVVRLCLLGVEVIFFVILMFISNGGGVIGGVFGVGFI